MHVVVVNKPQLHILLCPIMHSVCSLCCLQVDFRLGFGPLSANKLLVALESSLQDYVETSSKPTTELY